MKQIKKLNGKDRFVCLLMAFSMFPKFRAYPYHIYKSIDFQKDKS